VGFIDDGQMRPSQRVETADGSEYARHLYPVIGPDNPAR
jgi:hypothetical protein